MGPTVKNCGGLGASYDLLSKITIGFPHVLLCCQIHAPWGALAWEHGNSNCIASTQAAGSGPAKKRCELPEPECSGGLCEFCMYVTVKNSSLATSPGFAGFNVALSCHISLAASLPSSQPRGLSLPCPDHEPPKCGPCILYLKCVIEGENIPQSFACGLAEWADQEPVCI